MRGTTTSTLSRRSSSAPPPTPRTPPRRLPCRQGHGKPSSTTRFRASAPPTPPKPSACRPTPPTPKGHRRPTDLATSPPPGHWKGKGQREGPQQGGAERRKVTATHPGEQGTRGNTTQGKGTSGGPPTPREGKGRGYNTRERGGHKDRRQDTHPRRRDVTHRSDGHRPTPHTQSTPRDPQGTVPDRGTRWTSPDAHAHQDTPPQSSARTTPGARKSPAPTRGGYTHTGDHEEHRTTHHHSLPARR